MVKKHGIYIKKKTLPYETNRANERRSGTTRNRTGDTRIFSPLLYQLSYGTIILAFCECKDRRFLSISQIFEQFSCQKCTRFRILLYLCTRKSGFSAVGSALRSGRRGRWFESSNPDSKAVERQRLSTAFFVIGTSEYRHQRYAYLPDIDRKRTLRRETCNHRRNTLTLNALQKAAFYMPKGHLPQCERWPFRTRFTVFYKTAGRITSPNRALVSPSVLPRRALPCRYCPSCRLPYAMSDRNCFAGSRGRRR